MAAPRLGDHHHHGVRERAAGEGEHLEHVVEHRRRRRLGDFLERDQIVAYPLSVGLLVRGAELDLLVGDDAAFFGVDQEHAAGLQASLLHYAVGREVGSTPTSEARTTRPSLVT